ncbi:MAG: Ser-Thr-rich GPI-anchored membrane family protein [Chryseotalea sp.]|jgi:hypothetical protein
MKRIYTTLCFLTGLFMVSTAQNLHVQRVELKGDEVILYYSLLDSTAGRTFSVNLYSSLDNFVNPLQFISGDNGVEVKPATERKLVWNAKKELGETFNSKISIELRAKVFIPFIRFDSFSKIKRGKLTEVTWRGGTAQNILNFELWRNGEKVLVLHNIPNAQHATIKIPANVKAGKGYTFKIIDSKNKDLAIQTAPFQIKPRTPHILKAVPLLAVGGALALLGGGGSEAESEIENPPAFPNR